MERCPVCRARLKDNAICHRCESDLSQLKALIIHVNELERQAVQEFVAENYDVAVDKLTMAIQLKPNAFSVSLLGYAQSRLIA